MYRAFRGELQKLGEIMNTLLQRLELYEQLMRLDRPIGILLLLWPTLWALWLASNGHPNIEIMWIFILGTVLMRSAGCVMNDYADRDLDVHVQRTQFRPMTTGKISTREAFWLAAGLSLLAFLLILPLNHAMRWWSIPALFLAGSYPYTKRFLAIPQAYLGVAFSFGIPMAFVAVRGHVPVVAVWLLLANVFWVVAYDTEYAMVDKADDLKLGIHTSAITFGQYDVLAVMLCYAASISALIWVGRLMHLGILFYAGLLVAAAISIYHYTLIRNRDSAHCFQAFLHNNWLGAAVFGGLMLDTLLKVSA